MLCIHHQCSFHRSLSNWHLITVSPPEILGGDFRSILQCFLVALRAQLACKVNRATDIDRLLQLAASVGWGGAAGAAQGSGEEGCDARSCSAWQVAGPHTPSLLLALPPPALAGVPCSQAAASDTEIQVMQTGAARQLTPQQRGQAVLPADAASWSAARSSLSCLVMRSWARSI